jgi:hypothetical protein
VPSSIVDRAKISEYLLNAAHQDNGGKAKFFEDLGFSATEPVRLVAGLTGVANGEVVLGVEPVHGVKYVVDGPLTSRTGKQAVVRTVWIIDRGEDVPRLAAGCVRLMV